MLFCALFRPASGHGQELFESNTSVRALGMGNAFVGVVDNSDSLFYNPAGLARVSGYNWLVFDPKAGINGDEILDSVNDLQGSATFEDTIREMYGDHVWAGGGVKSAFTMPNIGFAIFDDLNASVDINNPVYSNLDLALTNDFGYAMGFGIPVLPTLHGGINLRYVKRTGSRQAWGPSFIGSLNPDAIESGAQLKGNGYAMDLGLNLLVPGPVSPTLSFVWKNVGRTTYKPDGTTLAAPPSDENEMIVGAALNVDLPGVSIAPAVDFKYLNRADVQLGKKIHFGVELGLPLLDIRAGFNQGYYTLGAGVNLGILRVDAASYGVELGAFPGQREDRRYIIQVSLELGFDPANGGLFGGGGGKGGGGKGGWGGRRLKQRR